ncbi:glycosyltransferase [Oceanobacillus alkalisoli]|uniref:glycosyltransferase n=1 Tax=Oceanobacillus alkalisoli TaxID=2925113 RepID=UPI001EEFE055|nr:glycosyltransferase [Oceanobacillus alkalisoli]MCF3943109.1 glycosyltransferase [Oceanobacillus alkalisoli]MCG5104693.1 glycosyltransferase [Oceanobacillus alkalisoli]
MKHICILVSEHPFLDARIFKKEAKSLVKAGFQVTMIVPRRNGYLFDVDGTRFNEHFREEQFFYEGIKIITYEQIHHEKQLKKRYTTIRKSKVAPDPDRFIQLAIAVQADIYHAHEFYSLYAGVQVKRKLSLLGKQIKLIYDSHEIDPDPLMQQARRRKQIKRDMLKEMLKETDFVITVSESIKRDFLSMNATLPVEIIYNAPPLSKDYHPGQGKNEQLILVYEGVMNEKRGNFRKLMKIIELCNEHFPLQAILIGGNKKSESPLQIPSHLKDKIILTGWVDYKEIPEKMKGADLGWVDLNANGSLNNRYAMPNKFFSYLNHGLPVIVNQCDDMEEFIKKYDCGYIVKGREATAEDYAESLCELHANRSSIHMMSRQARKVMEERFSWEQMEKRLLSIYHGLTVCNPPTE